MKTRILLSIGLFAVFLLYRNIPKYYIASELACFASFADLTPEAYEQTVLSTLANKKPSDFRYFFQTFLQQDGNDYLVVNIRNKNLCFNAKMRIEKWDKLSSMKRTNGVSYPKELYDLDWKIEQRKGHDELIYKNMHVIID